MKSEINNIDKSLQNWLPKIELFAKFNLCCCILQKIKTLRQLTNFSQSGSWVSSKYFIFVFYTAITKICCDVTTAQRICLFQREENLVF